MFEAAESITQCVSPAVTVFKPDLGGERVSVHSSLQPATKDTVRSLRGQDALLILYTRGRSGGGGHYEPLVCTGSGLSSSSPAFSAPRPNRGVSEPRKGTGSRRSMLKRGRVPKTDGPPTALDVQERALRRAVQFASTHLQSSTLNVLGDGNCFWYAVAAALAFIPDVAGIVRDRLSVDIVSSEDLKPLGKSRYCGVDCFESKAKESKRIYRDCALKLKAAVLDHILAGSGNTTSEYPAQLISCMFVDGASNTASAEPGSRAAVEAFLKPLRPQGAFVNDEVIIRGAGMCS